MAAKNILLCSIVFFAVQGCRDKDSPNEQFIVGLPQNATYGTWTTKEGIYTDPIHGFFEVLPPHGFRIDPKFDKTTSKIPDDSPGGGEVVPASRINFKTEGALIGVDVSRTFTTSVDEDIDMDKLKSGASGGAATVHLVRRITIDDVPGVEYVLTIHKGKGMPSSLIMHTVAYVKDGLYHGIVLMTIKPDIYLKCQADFIEFLHSYHSKAMESTLKDEPIQAGKQKAVDEINKQIDKNLGDKLPGGLKDVIKPGIQDGLKGLFGGAKDPNKK